MNEPVVTMDKMDPQVIADHLKISLEEAEYMVEASKLAGELAEADPTLSYTAYIIAQDRVGAKRWRKQAEEGKISWETAVNLTGSYARLDQAITFVAEGHLPPEWLAENLPELWAFSDPDDTDLRFLVAWQTAAAGSDGTILDDPEQPLPAGETITIYRGQDRGAPVGFAWTTDLAIAEKFAAGAGLRQSKRNGVVLVATVARDKVLAHLTKRSESETIVDPADVAYVANPIDGSVQRG